MEHKMKTGNGNKDISLFKPFVMKPEDNGAKFIKILNSDNASKMHSGFVTLKPGEEIGEHTTGSNEELVIVLSGKGKIEAEGAETKEIIGGEVAYNPPATRHNIINTGNEVMQYIYVVSEA